MNDHSPHFSAVGAIFIFELLTELPLLLNCLLAYRPLELFQFKVADVHLFGFLVFCQRTRWYLVKIGISDQI